MYIALQRHEETSTLMHFLWVCKLMQHLWVAIRHINHNNNHTFKIHFIQMPMSKLNFVYEYLLYQY